MQPHVMIIEHLNRTWEWILTAYTKVNNCRLAWLDSQDIHTVLYTCAMFLVLAYVIFITCCYFNPEYILPSVGVMFYTVNVPALLCLAEQCDVFSQVEDPWIDYGGKIIILLCAYVSPLYGLYSVVHDAYVGKMVGGWLFLGFNLFPAVVLLTIPKTTVFGAEISIFQFTGLFLVTCYYFDSMKEEHTFWSFVSLLGLLYATALPSFVPAALYFAADWCFERMTGKKSEYRFQITIAVGYFSAVLLCTYVASQLMAIDLRSPSKEHEAYLSAGYKFVAYVGILDVLRFVRIMVWNASGVVSEAMRNCIQQFWRGRHHNERHEL